MPSSASASRRCRRWSLSGRSGDRRPGRAASASGVAAGDGLDVGHLGVGRCLGHARRTARRAMAWPVRVMRRRVRRSRLVSICGSAALRRRARPGLHLGRPRRASARRQSWPRRLAGASAPPRCDRPRPAAFGRRGSCACSGPWTDGPDRDQHDADGEARAGERTDERPAGRRRASDRVDPRMPPAGRSRLCRRQPEVARPRGRERHRGRVA